MSWQWVHTLMTRYETGGLEPLEPRSRRPHTTATATPTEVRDRVVQLPRELTDAGLDAGPVTITWHLDREGIVPLATSTIRRILTDAGLIVAEPRKRPRSSYIRFAAEQPNETWQSDFATKTESPADGRALHEYQR